MLLRAHAHNDYEHPRPLLDALDCGFGSVEADIWLNPDGPLLVGHTRASLAPNRTLRSLYLEPLRRVCRARNGRVYSHRIPLTLMIDIKTAASPTIEALRAELAAFSDLLFVWGESGNRRPVRVIVSGNRSEPDICRAPRWMAMDGRPNDLDGKSSPADIPWISDSWSAHFKWNGEGAMPPAELEKLSDMAARVHAQRRQLRFWGYPDTETVWQTLWDAGVDYINTDRLAECAAWMRRQSMKVGLRQEAAVD
jgi:hypothetical protein